MQKRGLFGMNGFMVFLLTCLSVAARAQQTGYLILLEAENKQTFTVRLGDQFYTSSGHGHLVLSHLRDSIYRLNIRFPKKNMNELIFPVVVHQKDLGFQLQGNDSVWVLYNWQTKENIHPVIEKDSSRILDQGVKREDGFSRLMASVVNDSSVMYNTYTGNGFGKDSSIKDQGPKPLSAVASAKLDKAENTVPKDSMITSVVLPSSVIRHPSTVLVISDKKGRKDSLDAVKKTRDSLATAYRASRKDSLTAVRKTRDSLANAGIAARKDSMLAIKRTTVNPLPSTVILQPSSLPPGIKKLREVSLKISRKIIYLDVGRDGLTDTITLFVYFENPDTPSRKQALTGHALVIKNPSKPDSTEVNSQAARKKPALKASESGCGQLATDADIQFLRSAILKANIEKEKIGLAASAFEQKCFTVSQIRFLAALFVSDKAKYLLMDAAHLHIADQDHFRELVNMYTDKNFQRKFLAMADKRS
jgi:hypothetical protein